LYFHPAPNKCELNCRAVGFRFYATLNKTAVDGTPCNGAGGERWVCVSGLCKVGSFTWLCLEWCYVYSRFVTSIKNRIAWR